MSKQNFLSTEEAAAYLGISASTLANWRRKQTGPVYRKSSFAHNTPCQYTKQDLDRWLAAWKTVKVVKPKRAVG